MSQECIAWIGFAGSVVGAFLAGVVAIVVMLKTTKQTKDIQDDNKKDLVKPILVFYGDDKKTHVLTKESSGTFKGMSIKYLRNIGNGCAFDINVESDLKLNFNKSTITKMLIKDETNELKLYSDEIFGIKDNEDFSIYLKYKDMYNNSYTTNYKFKCDKNCFTVISCIVK